MNLELLQLIYFAVYALVFLVLGKMTFSESESISKFIIGERKNDVRHLFFTFAGTWVSAATILGFTGNVYHQGMSVLISSVIPWFVGAGLLYWVSDRLYDNDIMSIPQLIGKKYGSKSLRVLSAAVMIGGYVLYLVIQIKGFGIAAASLLHIDYKVAIFLVYLFLLYSSVGGFHSVTRSNMLNLLMLSVSVAVLYWIIMGRLGGPFLLDDQGVYERIQSKGVFFSGGPETANPILYLTPFFGWGLGLAVNPQYMIRLVAAKDKKTAKRTILWSLAFLGLLYFGLTQIGLGLRVLFPQLRTYCLADDVVVYAVSHLMQSAFSGIFLISVIGVCVSTANSQLLLVGFMASFDVMAQLLEKKMTEEQILLWSRVFIFAGGTAALLLSVNPPADTFSFGADIWGLFAAVFTPLIYGSLCFRGGTRAGAFASFFAGLFSSAVFRAMDPAVYWAFPATVCSIAVYVIIPMIQRRREGLR